MNALELISDHWEGLLMIVVCLIMGVLVVRAYCEQEKRNREISRAFEESNERKAQAEERHRIYEEKHQHEGKVLKQRVLDELKAVARGEKSRLDTEAVSAAKALQMRQGEHPETLAAWKPLLDDVSAETLDPAAIHTRFDELLYPETLEDVDALKKRVVDDLGKISRGEKARPDAETLDAARALNEIRARDTRRMREEIEADALATHREREKSAKQAAIMDEMARSSARNILRMRGLRETAFDGLPLDEILVRVRALRELDEEEKKKP